eukprot:TRINITY_DN103566_c0_g1_i1.p1 TRINITY_DN103566_c0_g1~~TRINITY_DN103566_c0_g1_i1.p1  ORF type:complete len:443 (+),score=32.73 TRINITY_DN103566_c0_g1_i1:20-1348(+)
MLRVWCCLVFLCLGHCRKLPLLGYNTNVTPIPLGNEPGSTSMVNLTAANFKGLTFRYPGGTVAEYWDWTTGWYNVSNPAAAKRYPWLPSAKYHNKSILLWADFMKKISARGSVWDLSVVWNNLQSAMQMLKEVQRVGLAVQHVELGNELYDGHYKHIYPSGTTYMETILPWFDTLAKEFPGVTFGFPFDQHLLDPKATTWNNEMLKLLPTNSSQAAAVLHPYVFPDFQSKESPQQVTKLLINGTNLFIDWVKTNLPPHMPVWFTEYNWNTLRFEKHTPREQGWIYGTWLWALSPVYMSLKYMTLPQVSILLVHDLGGRNISPLGSIRVESLKHENDMYLSLQGHTLGLLARFYTSAVVGETVNTGSELVQVLQLGDTSGGFFIVSLEECPFNVTLPRHVKSQMSGWAQGAFRKPTTLPEPRKVDVDSNWVIVFPYSLNWVPF